MKGKEIKYLALFAIPHACIIIFCLIMIIYEIATPYMHGFGVDSLGRIYVCENGGIGIYQERNRIEFVDVPGDNYLVSIDSNDQIYVVYTSRVDQIDMSGNVLKTTDDPNSHAYAKLVSTGKKLTTEDGDTYRLLGNWAWTLVIKNNSEIVYYQSVVSFCVKMLLHFCVLSMIINGVWLIQHILKMNQNRWNRWRV